MADAVQIPVGPDLFAIVDQVDAEKIRGYKWHPIRSGTTFYAATSLPPKSPGGSWPSVRMHRMILSVGSDEQVDHKNHDGLDNRRSNLRICNQSQNNGNRRLSSGNTSGYKGVHWDGVRHLWRAYIRVDGRALHLGRFRDPESAAAVYDEAAIRHFGEFALTNATLSRGNE